MLAQFANIASPSEVVVTTSFTLEFGDSSGTIYISIPYATLEPIRDVLYSSAQGDSNEPDRRWVTLLKEQIQTAEVEVVVTLARVQSTVAQLLALEPGDFFELDLKPVIQAQVSGVPLFDCHYGTSNGRYALKVNQLLTHSASSWIGQPPTP
jgi:flagellar motor switch protein FliM